MEVQPVTLDEGGDYFAISHVWTDGLGSTTEVGIPLFRPKGYSNCVSLRQERKLRFGSTLSVCLPKPGGDVSQLPK